MELDKLNVSPEEIEGVWCDYPGSDLRLRIASMHSPRYQKAMRRGFSKARRNSHGKSEEDIEEEVQRRAFGEAILVGWENLTEGGKKVEYSTEKSVELVLSLPKLYAFVLGRTTREFNELSDEEAEKVENLGKG